ncbi:MAG: hypothetical protein ABIC91_07055, partial [Nanoarchaeota archaeon]
MLKYKNLLFGKKAVARKVAVLSLLILIGFIFLIIADFVFAGQDEISQLEQELVDAGYDWLVDYNVNYPIVEVYTQDSDELITTFNNVSEENWYKVYLTEMNGTFDVFDLKVVGGAVEFDYIVDPGSAPIQNTSRIYSTTNTTADDLQGFCNATDADADAVNYYYEWFKNDALFSQGSFSNYTGEVSQVSSLTNSSSMNEAYSVYVSGDYAYVASGSGSLTVIDVSTKTAPTQVGRLSNTSSMNNARSVFVSGDYAYVASQGSDSLNIIDISTKTAPTQVAELENTTSMDGATSVYVSGDYAYVASVNNDSLTIIDISTKSSPTQVGWLSNTSSMEGAQGIFVSGDYAYVASGTNDSLTIVDVSTKTSPTQVSSFSNSSLNGAYGVYVLGDYAYVASLTSDSLTIVDVSTKTSPTQVGYLTNSTGLNGALSVFTSGDYAYVANQYDDSLTIVDVSTKTSPTQVGYLKNTSSMSYTTSVFVLGDYAYVIGYLNDSLTILDIADPFPQGLEINVNNISNNYLTTGDDWKLSCRAYDGSLFSGWLNSSGLVVQGIAGEDGCGTLSSAGTTYTLTSDVSSSGTCFTIGADNITLDCAGYTITGTQNGYGVTGSNKLNATVKNCEITNFTRAVSLEATNNSL